MKYDKELYDIIQQARDKQEFGELLEAMATASAKLIALADNSVELFDRYVDALEERTNMFIDRLEEPCECAECVAARNKLH